MVIVHRVNYGSWALRVVTWDAVLPVCVAFVPMVFNALFPNLQSVVVTMAVLLPFTALCLRLRSGKRHIFSNHCSRTVQKLQFYVFFAGITPLVTVEFFLIIASVLPKGFLVEFTEGYSVFAVLLSIYLGAMIIAMYPGRETVVVSDSDADAMGWSFHEKEPYG